MNGSWKIALAVPLVASAWSVACSSREKGAPVAAAATDGGDAASVEGGEERLEPADGGEAGAPDGGCEGACTTTQAAVSFAGKQAPLDRAQFGLEVEDGGVPRYYAEMHFGGDPACPSQQSPSPDRTFVLAHIPRGAPGQVFTEKDGLAGSFLDFKGDLVQAPVTKATGIRLVFLGIDTAAKPGWLAYDVRADFAEGGLEGHVYARRCDSLDE